MKYPPNGPDEFNDKELFYVAYLSNRDIQTLYQALDTYEMHMEPLSRSNAERIAIATDALKEAVSKGQNFLGIDV